MRLVFVSGNWCSVAHCLARNVLGILVPSVWRVLPIRHGLASPPSDARLAGDAQEMLEVQAAEYVRACVPAACRDERQLEWPAKGAQRH